MELDVTLFTAAVCGLIYLALSYRVSQTRMGAKISIGDAGNEALITRIRTHANFAEYVPIILILMGLIELSGGSRTLLWIVGLLLIAARIAHAIGMGRPAPNPYRMSGTAGTWLILALLSLWGLLKAL